MNLVFLPPIMKYIGVLSGGKDSIYNVMQCQRRGHELVAVVHLYHPQGSEVDSYMLQSVACEWVPSIAMSLGVPCYSYQLSTLPSNHNLPYQVGTEADEVEVLYHLVRTVVHLHPGVTAIASGAILSDYQRCRLEGIAQRLGLVSLSYLWHLDQCTLLEEMIEQAMEVMIVKVATLGLDESHLGLTLANLSPRLLTLHGKYGCNPCGEGGEFESLVLDCPLYHYTLRIDSSRKVGEVRDGDGSAHMVIDAISLIDKTSTEVVMGKKASPPMIPIERVAGGVLHIKDFDITTLAITNSLSPSQQMALLLLRLMEVLHQEEALLGDALYVNIIVRDMACFADINRIYSQCFSTSPPARACVQMALPPGVDVQLDVLVPTLQVAPKRKVLHVQSLSSWAPACIGPYSQCTSLYGQLMLAGQIALRPEDLELVGRELSGEAQLEVEVVQMCRNMKQVLDHVGGDLSHLLRCYLYIATSNYSLASTIEAYWDQFSTHSSLPLVVFEAEELPKQAQVELQCIGSVATREMSHCWEEHDGYATHTCKDASGKVLWLLAVEWLGTSSTMMEGLGYYTSPAYLSKIIRRKEAGIRVKGRDVQTLFQAWCYAPVDEAELYIGH